MQTAKNVRQSLLDAGMSLLQEQGVTALTQPRVAAAAGVKQSHLTYYFPKRGDLLLGIAEHTIDTVMTDLAGRLERRADPRTMREGITATMIKGLPPRVMMGLFVAADADPALRPALRRLIRGIRLRIRGLLERSGLPATEEAVALFHAAVIGLSVLHHARRSPESARELKSGVGLLLGLLAQLPAGDSKGEAA